MGAVIVGYKCHRWYGLGLHLQSSPTASTGLGMSPWICCSFLRLLADHHSLPFPALSCKEGPPSRCFGPGRGGLVGRRFGVGNLAFQFGRQTTHTESRGFRLCPPVPLCFACSMSHFCSLLPPNFPQPKQLAPPSPPKGMHWKGRDLRGGTRSGSIRLEEVAKAVGGGYCRLQMPLRLALAVRGTVAGHRLGAREGGGGSPPFQCTPDNPPCAMRRVGPRGVAAARG